LRRGFGRSWLFSSIMVVDRRGALQQFREIEVVAYDFGKMRPFRLRRVFARCGWLMLVGRALRNRLFSTMNMHVHSFSLPDIMILQTSNTFRFCPTRYSTPSNMHRTSGAISEMQAAVTS
jgi:hypothetical protein